MAEKITMNSDGTLNVPSNPIIPFIEGDGTGVDIWPAAKLVLDAAAERHGRTIEWLEVLAGEKAFNETGDWLPEDTITKFREYLIGIKGPLTTPIGGGFRSLNVALRQILDLYVCLRPVRWFEGVPSPVKHPEKVDMVIFRENTEDIYAGIEFEADSPDVAKVLDFLAREFPQSYGKIRFPKSVGIGFKPVSREGTERLVRAAIEYALSHGRKSVTFVHKGNIMKFTEGAFRNWGYELAEREFGERTWTWQQWERAKAAHGEAEAEAAQQALAMRQPLVKALLARASGDFAGARTQLEALAGRRDLEALYWRGVMQEAGEGAPPDPTESCPPCRRFSHRCSNRTMWITPRSWWEPRPPGRCPPDGGGQR